MLSPRSFQLEAIECAVARNAYIMDGCGTGKTLVGVETGLKLRQRLPRPLPFLVVTPKTPRWQWESTILEQDPQAQVFVIDSKAPIFDEGASWAVCHPDFLRSYADLLVDTRWGLVIVDEAHLFRNRNTAVYKALTDLRVYRKLALSATPMHKDPSELWAMLSWLYPQDFPSYWHFRNRYADYQENYMGYKTFMGPKHTDELAIKLKDFTFRRTLADVPGLPARHMTVVNVPANPQLLKAHEDVFNAPDIVVDALPSEPVIINTLAAINYLRQLISNPPSKGFNFEGPKIKWACDYVKENPEQRIVVLCYYIETAKRLGEVLKVPGLYGASPIKDQAVADFQQGKSTLLVGTFGALGTGTDLPGADVVIIVDLLYQRIQLEQAIDRIYRINITTPKFIKLLRVPDTVDDLLVKAIEENWGSTKLVLAFIAKARRDSLTTFGV